MKQQVFALILFRLTSGQITCHKEGSKSDEGQCFWCYITVTKLQPASLKLLHDCLSQRASVVIIRLSGLKITSGLIICHKNRFKKCWVSNYGLEPT